MAEEYKPNSHRFREKEAEARKPEKVVTGEVTRRKKTGLSKAAEILAPGDTSSIKNYILMDVLIPAIRRAISDVVCNGVNMLLGEPTRRSGGTNGGKVSYRSYYDNRDGQDRREYGKNRRLVNYDDLVFDNRGDAEEVLYRMEEIIDRFEVVSVADYLELAGEPSEYTDNKYGWTDLRSARVERRYEGYVIVLPRATNL